MDEYYATLTSRNGYFIPHELQARIRSTRLVLAGCGLSSSIAITAARLGFERFVFIDGDDVELTNLNRQSFVVDQVGKNKVLRQMS